MMKMTTDPENQEQYHYIWHLKSELGDASADVAAGDIEIHLQLIQLLGMSYGNQQKKPKQTKINQKKLVS